MRKNIIKEKLQGGEVVYSGWLHIPGLWSAELMGHAGWDALTVDLQHGLMGMEKAINMMQVISGTPSMPLARCNWNSPGEIMKLLDGGAYGIICPMVNTKEECERFVKACKYPPQGYRSFGPTRGRIYGGSDYGEKANDEILTVAMIETKEAIHNLDAILSVEGLDAIFVGSGDLKLSLTGKVGHDRNPQEFDEAIGTILVGCNKHNVIPGIWSANVNDAISKENQGFKFIAVASDSMMLGTIANQYTKDLKNRNK